MPTSQPPPNKQAPNPTRQSQNPSPRLNPAPQNPSPRPNPSLTLPSPSLSPPEPEPVTPEPEPVTPEPEPDAPEPEPVTPEPEPVTPEPEPDAPEPEAEPEPDAPEPEPDAPEPEAEPEPDALEPEPVTPEPEPEPEPESEPEAVATELEPEPEAVTPEPEPEPDTPDPEPDTPPATTERERDTSPIASRETIDQVVRGTNELAVDFFRAVADPADNAVIGNYSLSTALLLAMVGTAGDTTAAFGRLLGVDGVERDELHPAVNAVDLALESRTGEGVRLSTANSLFVQEGLELRDEFLDTAVGHYGAPVRTLDFMRRGDEAAAAVNEWVADETEGFIDRITDGFAEETVVVLANAMYLKASWAAVFERVDTPGMFTLADGTTVETEYMRHDGSLPLARGSDFVAVELPYEGEELGLVIVQPTDLAVFEKKMSAGRLREIAESLGIRNISLTVPTWSTKTSLDALDPLHRLGLPHTYDFGTMVDPAALARFGGGQLEIDEILHVARIEVDEKGTTAAAATSIGITVTSVPAFVTIDGPFFYFIHDRASETILFMGHVANPTVAADG